MTRVTHIPYYIGMAIFQGLVAFQWFVQNTMTTGNVSTIYMFSSIGAGLLAVVSLLYIVLENNGDDVTEADIEIPLIGLTMPKWLWYLLSFAIIGGQCFNAVIQNRTATGFDSVYSYIWFISSLVLILATFSNGKGYLRNRAVAASNRLKQTQHQASA